MQLLLVFVSILPFYVAALPFPSGEISTNTVGVSITDPSTGTAPVLPTNSNPTAQLAAEPSSGALKILSGKAPPPASASTPDSLVISGSTPSGVPTTSSDSKPANEVTAIVQTAGLPNKDAVRPNESSPDAKLVAKLSPIPEASPDRLSSITAGDGGPLLVPGSDGKTLLPGADSAPNFSPGISTTQTETSPEAHPKVTVSESVTVFDFKEHVSSG